MPELPEVETVRRGLAPVMEGARFARSRRGARDLRWPLPKDFAKRLDGPDRHGLGRRAKYLLADLSSGEVLLMHLGMSGSFRVVATAARPRPAPIYHERSKDEAHDHVVFHMSSGATHRLQRSAPLRLHEAGAARQARRRSRCCARSGRSRSATNSTPRCWRAPARARRPALKAALLRPARRRRARQHLCLRGAAPRAAVAEAAGLDHRRPQSARRTSARKRWSRPSRRCSTTRSRPAARRCATIASTDGELGMFQHNFRVYDREGETCPTPRLQRHDQAHRADRPLDLLLSGVPEIIFFISLCSPRRCMRAAC